MTSATTIAPCGARPSLPHFSGAPAALAQVDPGHPWAVAKAAGTAPYYSKFFPDEYRTPALPPGYRPGERILHGRPLVFNEDLLNAYQSDRLVEGAPRELSGLSWDDLTELFYAWLNRSHRRPRDTLSIAFGIRVCNERARRPEHIRAFGARS